MIRYLVDSSGLWRLLREPGLRDAWRGIITEGAVGSCPPQRAEFLRSARDLDEFETMSEMFRSLYPNVSVSKDAWRWIDSAQYRLCRYGAHRALSAVDLLICATAAARQLVILHDDKDFTMAAQRLTDVAAHRVHEVPGHPRLP